MKLSLSVRIAEGFLSKEDAILTLQQVAELASSAGYEAICMRASQLGVHSSPEAIAEGAAILAKHHVGVTMLTGDFATVYNNEQGPDSLRNITPYLDLAEKLSAPLIRVAVKTQDDIPHAQRAADEAAERDLTLVHQCHTLSRFETIKNIEATLAAIARPNFRLIYEAANLEICGQPYGAETIRRLLPHVANVYLQNQVIKPDGAVTLETWHHGPISFDIIEIHEPGGIEFPEIFGALKAEGYDGPVTVHQSAPEDGSSPLESAKATADYLRGLM